MQQPIDTASQSEYPTLATIQTAMGYTPLQVVPPVAATPFDPAPYPTALSFDPYADLLLVGSSSGTVTSYCNPISLERHAVYCAHGSKGFGTYSTMRMGFGTGEVRQLRVVDKEIWSLTEGGLAGAKRGGLVRWTVRYVAVNPRTDCSRSVAHVHLQRPTLCPSHFRLEPAQLSRTRRRWNGSPPDDRQHFAGQSGEERGCMICGASLAMNAHLPPTG
jgi:hypothetical protein